MRWQPITRLGLTRAEAEQLERYVGCNVRFRRPHTMTQSTELTGVLRELAPRYGNIGGIIVAFTVGDQLDWDSQGPKPRTIYTSEEKEFARILYDAHLSVRGGPAWDVVSKVEQDAWFHAAREGLKWADADLSITDRDSDDLDGRELQLAVAKKLADQRMEAWDIAVHDGNDVAFMKDAEEIIVLINKIQGTA